MAFRFSDVKTTIIAPPVLPNSDLKSSSVKTAENSPTNRQPVAENAPGRTAGTSAQKNGSVGASRSAPQPLKMQNERLGTSNKFDSPVFSPTLEIGKGIAQVSPLSNSPAFSPIVAPQIPAISLKTSTVMKSDDGSEVKISAKVVGNIDDVKADPASDSIPAEVPANKKSAMSSFMPEPLAIFTFKSDEIDNILAAAYQSYFEDKVSLEFQKGLISILTKNKSPILENVTNLVNNELKEAQNAISAIEDLDARIAKFDNILFQRQSEIIRKLSKEDFDKLGPDKFKTTDILPLDPKGILNLLSAGTNFDSKTTTAWAVQMLLFCSDYFRTGCSPRILGLNVYEDENKLAQKSGNSAISSVSILRETTRDSNLPTLASLSQANTIDTYLYKIKDGTGTFRNYSYVIPPNSFKDYSRLRKSAYLITMLANEFALSAGLGKLEDTPLGQTFGSTSNYVKNFLGTDSMSSATSETSSPNSLADYLIVDENGNNRVNQGAKGVAILDGNRFSPKQTRTNVYDAFLKGCIHDPTNSKVNKVVEFESSLNNALGKYSTGLEFYKSLHLRTKELKLLTPRGLFTRLISDFSDSLSSLYGDVNADNNQTAREIMLLSLLAKNNKASFSYTDSQKIKNYILTLIVKKYISQLNDEDTINSKKEKVSQSDKIVIKNDNGTVTFPGQQESEEAKKKAASLSFSPKLDTPRCSLNDQNVFADRLEMNLTIEVLSAIESNAKSLSGASAERKHEFTAQSFFEGISNSSDKTFIGKLLKIYKEMVDEANKESREQKPNSTFVNAVRLTKNSQMDSTISLAMILESASELCQIFVNSNLKFEPIYSQGDLAPSSKLTLFVNDISRIPLAQKALSAISAASENNDLSSLIKFDGEKEVVPEIDNAPLNTIISWGLEDNGTSLSSIRQVLNDLSYERDLPAACLATTSALFKFTKENASSVISFGKELIGDTSVKQSQIAKDLIAFSKTSVGSEFLDSFESFDIDVAKLRLDKYSKAVSSNYARNPKFTSGEYNCIKAVLPFLMSERQQALFITAGAPKQYIRKSVSDTYSIAKEEMSSKKEVFRLTVNKNHIFDNSESMQFSERFMIRRLIEDSAFDEFDAKEPKRGLDDIIESVRLRKYSNGNRFLQMFDDGARNILENSITSYLMRKLFSVVSSIDLMEENVASSFGDLRATNSKELAREFAKAYGMPENSFDNIFVLDPNTKLLKLDRNALANLAIDDFDDNDSSILLKKSILTMGEADLFFDTFSTVHFLQGTLTQRIFAQNRFDRIEGVLVSNQDFANLSNAEGPRFVSKNMIKNATQKTLQEIAAAKSPDILEFENYTIEMSSDDTGLSRRS